MIKLCCEQDEPLLESICTAAFEHLGLEGDAYIELDFLNEDEIRQINHLYRQKDLATDVLSFPLLDKILPFNAQSYPLEFDKRCGVNLGNVLICSTIARQQAKEFNHSYDREVGYLFVHGLLHLLGYDHESDSDKIIMRQAEEQILSRVRLCRSAQP